MERKPVKALIVDDNQWDREMCRRYLQDDTEYKCEIQDVETAEEALDAFDASVVDAPFDLVLVDYSLPQLSGLDFITEIKSRHPSRFIPIVMMTGQGSEDIAVEAMKRGAMDYAVKGKLTQAGLKRALRNAIERSDLLKQLEKQERELKIALEFKAEFIRNISHEIRTPLNAVIGSSDLLKAELQRDAHYSKEISDYVNTIHASSEALLTLINQVLDLSKVESGKLELEESRFNLDDLMSKISQIFSIEAKKKGISFSVQSKDSTLVDYLGDLGRIRQILINLTGNAFKFTSQGSILINASIIGSDSSQPFHTLKFEVKDSGIGIPKEKLARLFEAFSQADASITRKYGGTGLGLSISKKLVELMDGQIGVESSEGKGSTFWFTVKLKAVPAEDRTTETREEAGLHLLQAFEHPPQILVVEDQEINQFLMKRILEKLGCEIYPAENGKQALSKMKSQKFDLVLMDCQMPEMDGFEATQEIRKDADPHFQKVPIIALTAHSTEEDFNQCIQCGMNDVLTKPLDTRKLVDALLKWLPSGNQVRLQKTEAPSLDRKMLDELRSLQDGNDDIVGEIIRLYLESAPETFKNAQKAHQNQNFKDLEADAHRLKSSSGNIGAMKVYEYAGQLEKAAQKKDVEKSTKLIQILETEMDAVVHALNQELKSALKIS